MRFLIAAALALPLGGCVAKTALDVVTLPVKVASKTVDLATTSQAEADQKRGQELRRREERLGNLQREHTSLTRRCREGSRDACTRADQIAAEMQQLLPGVPLESAN